MYGRDRIPLFYKGDGNATFRNQVAAAAKDVDSLAEQQVLNSDLDALVQYFVDKFHVEVPVLNLDNVTASEHERQVEVFNHWEKEVVRVPGVAFDFEIPFSGEADVFQLRPSTSNISPPYADIRGQAICFSVADRELSADQVRQAFENTRDSIQQYLVWHLDLWRGLDDQIRMAVRAKLEQRRERLQMQKAAASGLASIGVKLKTKTGDTRTFAPPAVKKKIEPKLPPMRPAAPPDPILDQKQYEEILGLIRSAGRSIEQSSTRARTLEEEALRDILLVPLNAHFGTATGEAFNFTGKTDILIRYQGANLFVAECKIWGGDQHLLAAIDQLLSYLTWRDTKAALIVFNRNVGFSAVADKLKALPSQHSNFVSGPVGLDETSNRFVFSLPQDPNRHVTVSVLAFDLGPAS